MDFPSLVRKTCIAGKGVKKVFAIAGEEKVDTLTAAKMLAEQRVEMAVQLRAGTCKSKGRDCEVLRSRGALSTGGLFIHYSSESRKKGYSK